MNIIIPKVPDPIKEQFMEVVTIVEKLCNEKLNSEYCDLAVELAAKIARKRPSPLFSGSKTVWAAGIIHALGMVNFLFDKSQIPHLSSRDLCEWFDLPQNTINGKSKAIRNMFKIYHFDPKWCLPSKLEDNPMIWLISINGFMVNVKYATRDIQVAAYQAGLIPYIPAE
ncbi:MAG TPA: DUF6398 domain-containing protein [Chthoniobacterales bacterium]|nr:DUF6398 domain-containing protein [Chthoniobacterales bacterium]